MSFTCRVAALARGAAGTACGVTNLRSMTGPATPPVTRHGASLLALAAMAAVAPLGTGERGGALGRPPTAPRVRRSSAR